jgi:CMP-N-acetylneuraminic acid synthetase
MRVLGLIPARGGSKGVPRKNIRQLCGKPLLQYTAEAALKSKCLSKVILSTDDEAIARLGKQCGLEVPFCRPKVLAQDHTPMLSVVQHAIHFCESAGDYFDAICLLQPTNPLRKPEVIDACIELLRKGKTTAVITILSVPSAYNPHWVYFQNDSGLLKLSTGEETPVTRRQDLPPAFHREGSVYVTKRDVVMKENSLYGHHLTGYLVDQDQTINIDTQQDWERAEALLLNSER